MPQTQDRAEREYQELVILSRSRSNPVRYSILCEDLRIKESERDEDLYSRGLLERMNEKREVSGLELKLTPQGRLRKLSPLNNYVLGFLSEAKHLLSSSFDENVISKEKLLVQYFKRFRTDGKQGLSRYTSTQKGSVFDRVVRTYMAAADANNQKY